MPDYTPVYDASIRPYSKTCSAAVTGGQIVAVSGTSSVAPSAAAETKAVGVAAFDAAINTRISVWPLTNLEHEVVAAGTIAVGDGITAAAAGQVAAAAIATAAAAGTLIGIATTAATVGTKVRFLGRG